MSKLSQNEIESILSARFKDDEITELKQLPRFEKLKDIKKASLKIIEYLKAGKKVSIVGDYDVDGVTSSVILSEFFDDIGLKYELIIPNRFKDGYGLSEKILPRINTDLVITVDNGISAVNTAKKCKDQGITLIITDHHKTPPILPDAYAIVNPKQEKCEFEFSDICGAQVAWYLCASIKSELGIEYNLGKFLDILCISITADMMPLIGMNRVMVQSGIKVLNNSKRVFVKAIKDMFDKDEITFDDLSFLVSPLLNSSGRMYDAIYSYDFLSSKNYTKAYEILSQIAEFNSNRKEVQNSITDQAKDMSKGTNSDIIVVYKEDWHEGVIGIVASKLTVYFKKPAIVFSVSDGIAKGSARSVGDVDIYNLISKCKKYLLGFGGHKSAAGLGLKLENMQDFINDINSYASALDKEQFISNENILCELDIDIVDLSLVDILKKYEPYGIQNPRPSFTLNQERILNKQLLGREKNHQKLYLKNNIELLDFNFDVERFEGDELNIECTVSKNEFRGQVKPILISV
ncbi:MAG: Single-stranded-DNA-specific exonuclease RecJ (EC [uncultured Campylobacterales bacterium]|uniref:Single-stranded-DNA-specific exonuclease RecJ n=1 Tax=uncultured Campylobacterales bacterium TaxID=352960 RepID=A0A6S6TAU3_9BACT|nr:MAG: Single-stranded-DNA-specific exonuclease RecJ (EC [uncultured Campylobacterales bacterium]